ncbi:MAG: DUF4854 domain-containing protein [Agathobacter sp.]|nr:DUF4854 domain-containing protein [Agathobacter sp.]
MKKKLVSCMLATMMLAMTMVGCTVSVSTGDKDDSKKTEQSETTESESEETPQTETEETEETEADTSVFDEEDTSYGLEDTYGMTLEEWVKSSAMRSLVDSMNEAFSGTLKLSIEAAEEDVLLIRYTYLEQYDLTDASVSGALEKYFDEQMEANQDTFKSMYDNVEEATGIVLSKVVIEYDNADGSEIYSYDVAR